MKVTVKISMLILSTLAFMLAGCDNKSNNIPEDSGMSVECNTSILESGIHFDITEVDYTAVSVVDLDENNATWAGARQLAAQCAECHGTFGVAVGDTVENWPSLWVTGRHIAATMKDYNDTLYDYSAMHIHSSMTYTQDQIKLIQAYYQNITYTGGE